MKQHTVKKSQINFLAWCGLGLTIPCLSLFAGCGSSSTNTPVEPSVSAIVPATPPAADTTSPRTEVDASDSDPQVPPGTLELPADFDPTQSPSEAKRDLMAFRGTSPAEFAGWLRGILKNNVATAVTRT